MYNGCPSCAFLEQAHRLAFHAVMGSAGANTPPVTGLGCNRLGRARIGTPAAAALILLRCHVCQCEPQQDEPIHPGSSISSAW